MNWFILINRLLVKFNLVLIPNTEYDDLINMDLNHMNCEDMRYDLD